MFFTRKLLEAFDPKSMETLREEIAGTKALAEKEWLLEQMDDLV